jgi:ribosomal peptide maturation radical SAM protein 1
METARGCWWGEKHHCTFCGLNGSGMHFRSKSQERARDEVAALVTRYQVLDVILADNILDNEYFKNFLPAIVRDGWDLRLHYEIKANLKPAQIDLMRSAGVVHVQPGIESLSTRVLQLMDKGITGTRNVQALRDLHTANLSVSWNYLVGFPDETDDDYLEVIGQVRKLTHLQPPSGATRLALERFSPYFEKPWLGFERRWPHPAYPIIFSLDLAECDQFAFFFECDDLGISADCLRQVSQAIEDWRAAYEDGAALRYYTQENGDIEIIDGRPGFTGGQYTLTDRVQIAIFEVTSVPRKAAWLAARLDAEGFSRHDVAAALECLCDRLGLLFVEAGSYVNVTLPFAPYQRVDPQLLDAVFHPYH